MAGPWVDYQQPGNTPPVSITMQPPPPTKATPGGGTSAVGPPLDLINPKKPATARGSGLTDAQIDIALPIIFHDESGNLNVPQTAYHNQPGEINPSTGTHTGPSSASGYAQYIDSTWARDAPAAGIDLKQYPTAISAPRDAQVAVARYTMKNHGVGDWSPYNSTLRKHLVEAGIPVPDASYSGGNFKVSPAAVTSQQGRADTSVVYMAPGEYLSLLDPLEDDAAQKRKRTLLDKSLNAGDDLESIPTLDVKQEKGNLKVIDQDGRNRAQAAIDAGVDLIPVAIHGAPAKATGEAGQVGEATYNKLIGMNGQEHPFDFAHAPKGGVGPWNNFSDAQPPATKPTPGWLGALTGGLRDPHMPVSAQAAGGFIEGLEGQQNTVATPKTVAPGIDLSFEAKDLPSAIGRSVGGQVRGAVEGIYQGVMGPGEYALGQGVVPIANIGDPNKASVTQNALATAQLGMSPLRVGGGMGAQTVAPGGRFSSQALEVPTPGMTPAAPVPISPHLAALSAARPNALATVNRERAGLALEARQNFGIPIDATDLGHPNPLRELPLSGERAATSNKVQAWQRAMSREMGVDAPLITNEVVHDALNKAGSTINRIENSHDASVSVDFFSKMNELKEAAETQAAGAQVISLIKKVESAVSRGDTAGKAPSIAVDGYTHPATTVGQMLRKNGVIERATASGTDEIRYAGAVIKKTLQDELQAVLTPEEMAAYRTARYHYKVAKTLEPVARQSPVGILSPKAVASRVERNFTASTLERSTHMDRLALIGREFLAPKPTSPVGNALRHFGVPGVAGGVGVMTLGAPATIGIGSAAIAAGRGLGGILRSNALANRVIQRQRGGTELLRDAAQVLPQTRNYLLRGRLQQMQQQPPMQMTPPP